LESVLQAMTALEKRLREVVKRSFPILFAHCLPSGGPAAGAPPGHRFRAPGRVCGQGDPLREHPSASAGSFSAISRSISNGEPANSLRRALRAEDEGISPQT
jgi:hypothetical protein